jgi:hypothetical protein
MAEGATPDSAPSVSPEPSQEPAGVPRIGVLLLLYTLARIGITVALLGLLWVAGVPLLPALLFVVLLQLPVAYLLLRPLRTRLTEALAVRGAARREAKERLRARLEGEEGDGPAG